MPQEIPPRLEFPVDVTEKEYIEASLTFINRKPGSGIHS